MPGGASTEPTRRDQQTLPPKVLAMKNKWMPIILAALVVIAAIVYWPWKTGPDFDIPASMSGEEITACPEHQLITLVVTDLRFKLAADERNWVRWREMPEAARNVLALSWVEDDLPYDSPGAVFKGFGDLLGKHPPNMATLDDIAAAYENIGASGVAFVVRDAATIAGSPTGKDAAAAGGADAHRPYLELDGTYRDRVQRDESRKLLRAYIRAHAGEIASAHIPH